MTKTQFDTLCSKIIAAVGEKEYRDVAEAESNMDTDVDDDDLTFPLVVDNNEPKPPRRPDSDTSQRQAAGAAIRDEMCVTLYGEGYHRRLHPTKMKINSPGHVYCI